MKPFLPNPKSVRGQPKNLLREPISRQAVKVEWVGKLKIGPNLAEPEKKNVYFFDFSLVLHIRIGYKKQQFQPFLI